METITQEDSLRHVEVETDLPNLNLPPSKNDSLGVLDELAGRW